MEVAEEIEVTSPIIYELSEEDKGVFELNARVEQLETQVSFLQRELRLMRLKFRTADPNGEEYQKVLETTFLRLLDNQNWKMSRLSPDQFDGQRGNYKRSHPSNNSLPSRSATLKRKKIVERFVEVTSSDEDNSTREDVQEPEFQKAYESDASDSDDDVKYSPPKRRTVQKKRRRMLKKTKPQKKSKGTDTVIQDGDVAVILDDESAFERKDVKLLRRKVESDDEKKMDPLINIGGIPLTKVPENVLALYRYVGPDPKRLESHIFQCRADECESELTIKAKTQGYGNLYKHAKKKHGILKVNTPRVKKKKKHSRRNRRVEESDDDDIELQPPSELDHLMTELVGL